MEKRILRGELTSTGMKTISLGERHEILLQYKINKLIGFLTVWRLDNTSSEKISTKEFKKIISELVKVMEENKLGKIKFFFRNEKLKIILEKLGAKKLWFSLWREKFLTIEQLKGILKT